MTKKIRIRTRHGKIIVRKAEVAEFVENDGRQTCLAQVGICCYKVCDRDSAGPIFQAF